MRNKSASRILKAVLDFTETLLITFFTLTLVFTYMVKTVTINGQSMENTLMSGDKVIIASFLRNFRNGDVVVIDAKDSVTLDDDNSLVVGVGLQKMIVKRIIACGGQTVDIDFARGSVSVDGKMIDEDYSVLGLTHMDEGAFTGKYPVEVPEGYYFVLGDNRTVSRDSRSSDIGFVSEKSIMGKAVLRVYPFESFGTID